MLACTIGLILTQAAAQVDAQADKIGLEPFEVAAGILVFPGQPGPADKANLARLANTALIVGPEGALVWNTGVSHRHGQELLAAMLHQIEVPIRAAVISHAYQDVLFGWSAFNEIGIEVMMHQGAVQLMHKRCQGCIDRLTKLLGPQEMTATRLASPSRILTGPESIISIGRELQILDSAHSSGPHDLMLFDKQTGTLFAGPAVMTDTVIEIRDGQIETWIDALNKLSTMPVRLVVPDYGSTGDADSIATTLAYLQGLQNRIAALLEQGVSLADAVEQADMPEFAQWPGYREHHGRNAHQLYLNMETRFFE